MSIKLPWRGIISVLVMLLVLTACGTRRPAPVEERGNWRRPPVAATKSASYTVATGDTLYSIAFRFNVDWRELARWNNIRSPYLIHPGDRLRLTAPPAQRSVAARKSSSSKQTDGKKQSASPKSSSSGASSGSSKATTRPTTGKTTSKSPSAASKSSSKARAKAPNSSIGSGTSSATKNSPKKSSSAGVKKASGVEWRWPVPGRVIRGFNPNSVGREGLDLAGKVGETVRAAASGTVVYSGRGLIGYGELIIIKHNDRLLSAYGHNRKRLVQEGDQVKAGQAISEMGQNSSGDVQLHFEIRVEGKPQNPINYLPRR